MREEVIKMLRLDHPSMVSLNYADTQRWSSFAARLGFNGLTKDQKSFLENFPWENFSDKYIAEILPVFFIFAWRRI
jgi:hypothetical protein